MNEDEIRGYNKAIDDVLNNLGQSVKSNGLIGKVLKSRRYGTEKETILKWYKEIKHTIKNSKL